MTPTASERVKSLMQPNFFYLLLFCFRDKWIKMKRIVRLSLPILLTFPHYSIFFLSLSFFLSFFLSLSHPFQMRSPEIHISVFDASLNNNSLMNSCRWVVISLTSFDTKWTSVIWVQWCCFATELNFSNN